jgi:nucleoside-diphosphate-sugar epimerase
LRLLVSGAAGFTGRHFVRSAVAAGHTVVVLRSDLSDRDGLEHEVLEAAPEAVVHLAAVSFVGHADAGAFYKINLLGTLNLLDSLVALPQKPKRILLASSANVYGDCRISPISEDQNPVPINHYATSKLAMEFMSKTYLDKLPLFFVRPFNYTGPGQSPSFLIPKLVKHFVAHAASIELGNLGVEREFNDVRFVCESYLRLLEAAEPGGTYNVCSGNPVSLLSVVDLLKTITGQQMEIKVNPAFVRINEIPRLCGDPTKLQHCIGALQHPSLTDTLKWMLAN